MSKAVNSNSLNENTSGGFSLDVYVAVTKYRPLFRRLMTNPADAEDLEQEVVIKMIGCFAKRLDWWNGIEHKKAYMVRMIRNKALDLKTRKSIVYVDRADDEGRSLLDDYSDDGKWLKDLNEEMDLEPKRLLLKEITDEFSDYEQILIQMNFVDGLKPKEIAECLNMNFAEVQQDCNRVKASLRGKLKKRLLSR